MFETGYIRHIIFFLLRMEAFRESEQTYSKFLKEYSLLSLDDNEMAVDSTIVVNKEFEEAYNASIKSLHADKHLDQLLLFFIMDR